MGNYTGAEQAMTDRWVKESLESNGAAFDLISPGLGARIYADFAPADAVYPFIIFQCQQPPRDIRGVGTFRVMVDTLYLVKAVAQLDTYDPLVPIAKEIDAAMTTSTGSAVDDGLVLTSVRNDQFSMVEVEDGTQFRHFGGEYSIQATAQA